MPAIIRPLFKWLSRRQWQSDKDRPNQAHLEYTDPYAMTRPARPTNPVSWKNRNAGMATKKLSAIPNRCPEKRRGSKVQNARVQPFPFAV